MTRGFLISVYATEPLYEKEFDVTDMEWSTLRSFLRELGEAVRDRDDEYREHRSRGRSLKIYYKRIRERTPSGKTVTRELKFLRMITVPSRVLSIMSRVKQIVYLDLIPNYCEKLMLISAGKGRRRVIYFLPDYNLEPFLQELKNLNKQVEEANKILKEYAKSIYFKRINKILKEYGFDEIPQPEPIPHIDYDLAPLIFDPEAVKQWIENKELVQQIEEKIRQRQKQIVEKAVKTLKTKVNALIEKIKSEEFTEEKAKEAIKEISKIAESIGIQSIVAPTLKHLEDAIEHPYQLDPKIAKQLDKRIKSLLENL